MRKLVLAVGLVLMASGAQAVTLDVIGGQLMGASNVLVDGSFYDVQFLDGTCIDVYDGCDPVFDFTFQTQASAVLASQPLLDQVFLDGVEGHFDSFPQLTNGCSDPTRFCVAITPYGLADSAQAVGGIIVGSVGAINGHYLTPDFPNFVVDVTQIWGAVPSASSVSDPLGTYAVWSASVVPEPTSALLLGPGLTGLAARGRRRNRS